MVNYDFDSLFSLAAHLKVPTKSYLFSTHCFSLKWHTFMAFIHEENKHLFQKWLNIKNPFEIGVCKTFSHCQIQFVGHAMDFEQIMSHRLFKNGCNWWLSSQIDTQNLTEYISPRGRERKKQLLDPPWEFSLHFSIIYRKKIGPLIRGLEAQNHTPSPCEAKLHPPARD